MTAKTESREHGSQPEELDEAECWELLRTSQLCRIGFVGVDGFPDIRPVNHFAVDESMYIRSAVDSKFLAVTSQSRVAVEVDGADDADFWSVVVRGIAEQVTSESGLHRVGAQHFQSWTATPKLFVLKITPSVVTGRRFPKFAPIMSPAYAVPITDKARAQHREKRGERPAPIPHFEPPTPS